MSLLEGKWTKVFYLDINLTYLRLCDNEAISRNWVSFKANGSE